MEADLVIKMRVWTTQCWSFTYVILKFPCGLHPWNYFCLKAINTQQLHLKDDYDAARLDYLWKNKPQAEPFDAIIETIAYHFYLNFYFGFLCLSNTLTARAVLGLYFHNL